jgi:glycosyltransferase involved in cell wall biosynthesis
MPQDSDPEISVVIPCLNEEEGILYCLNQIESTLSAIGTSIEVVVVDNASTDRTAEIVREKMQNHAWLRLVEEQVRGYGSAYLRGLKSAKGTYFFMADADGTYDFKDIPRYIEKLRAGADMVIGDRFAHGLAKGTMPWLNRYVGNPVLSTITRLFFKIRIHDIHCGARAMSRVAFQKITLYTTGMEFASEMIIKAAKAGLQIEEIPITYSPRIGESKLNSFGDGWRHLRFILLYSPLILFTLPGMLLFLIGVISMTLLYFSHLAIFDIQLFVHPMFLSAILLLLGYQLIFFGGFAKTYAITHLGDTNTTLQWMFRHLTIEKAGIVGIFLTLLGLCVYILIYSRWYQSGFGSLNEIKNSIVALTLFVLGIQTFFSAFMLSIIGIKERHV